MIARLIHALTRRRPVLARACALAALLVMIASAYRFRSGPLVELNQAPDRAGAYDFAPGRPRNEVSFAGVGSAARLMLIGGGLLIAALALASFGRESEIETGSGNPLSDTNREHGRSGRLLIFARRYGPGLLLLVSGAILLFLLAEANGQWIALTRLDGMPPRTQFALLCGGVILVAWGLSNLPTNPRSAPRRGRKIPLAFHDLSEPALVAALTVIALALRVWHLNTAIHAFVDELNFATGVRQFWLVKDVRLLTPITEVVAFPRLYPYLESGTVALLGRNLAGLRLVSAILGALTIPALYALARALFDRQTAFSAAALLAAFPAHLHYSRLGLNNIADPFFGTLSLACMAWALRTQRRRYYALAGVMLGLTQYFYEAGRIVFPALMVGWIGIGVVIGRKKADPPTGPRFKASTAGLIAAALAALITAAPVYYTLLGQRLPLAARSGAMIYPAKYWRDLLVSPSGSTAFRDHLRHIEETFLIDVHQHEASFYYAGETPFVLIYLAPLLLFGVFAALWRLRTPGGLLVLLWIAVVPLGNSFMVANMDSPRYVAVFPALALGCAVGLRGILALLWPDRMRPRARQAVLVGLLVALAAGQAWYYFDRHVDLFNYQYQRAKLDRDFEDALFRSVHFPPGTQIHIISTVRCDQGYANDLINYLTDGLRVDTLTRQDVTQDYLLNLPVTVDHAFFLEPDDQDTLALLRLYFKMQPPAYTSYPLAPDKQFVLYYAPTSIHLP